MEKNARRAGIIVKIRYGRGRRKVAAYNPGHSASHIQPALPGKHGAAARTRLSIVIKAQLGKGQYGGQTNHAGETDAG